MMPLFLAFLAAVAAFANVTAFVNVNVLPMDSERILERQTVLIEGDRIVAMGPVDAVVVPAGATVIDGTGMWLMPGLAEMHGHIPPPTQPREEIETVLFLYAANGITTVRGMLGWPGQLELREEARTGDVLSPTLYLAGPSFSGRTVSTPDEARARVRRQVAEGWDLLKVHPGLDRATYDAMAEEAHRLGISFGGHVPEDVGLLHALEMGQLTFDHMDGFNAHLGADGPPVATELAAIVEKTRDAGAWIVPTSVLWELFLGVASIEEMTARPELRYTSAQNVATWTRAYRTRLENAPLNNRQMAENRKIILKALSDGGVPILMGTDAPQQFSIPGFSLHRETAWMVRAGMSPFEVLQSGTQNVGRYFADKDTFGLVAEDHRADLLLLTANPLEDIHALDQIEGVMLRGRWLPRMEIDARLAEIESFYAGQ